MTTPPDPAPTQKPPTRPLSEAEKASWIREALVIVELNRRHMEQTYPGRTRTEEEEEEERGRLG